MEDFLFFVCPLTGEQIRADVDALASHWLFLQEQSAKARLAMHELARALQKMAPGTHGTERLRGQSCRVKLEQAQINWSQPLLRAAREEFPKLSEGVIEPTGQLRVSLREYDKIARETGDESFTLFKQKLQAACLGRTGPPRITVEYTTGDSHVDTPVDGTAREHTENDGVPGRAVPAGGDPLEAPGG